MPNKILGITLSPVSLAAAKEGRLGLVIRAAFKPGEMFCGFNGYGNPVVTPDDEKYREVLCPFPVGATVFGRETWADSGYSENRHIVYRADCLNNRPELVPYGGTWRRASTMPHWASRFIYTVTSATCRQVSSITEEEARQAGIKKATKDDRLWKFGYDGLPWMDWKLTVQEVFASAFNQTAKPGQRFEDNPWCWFVGIGEKR